MAVPQDAADIPIPDEDAQIPAHDEDDEVRIVPRDDSPKRARKTLPSGDPDTILDGLLSQQANEQAIQGAPSWAVAMHNASTNQFQLVRESVSGLHDRVAALETKSDNDPRIGALERQLGELRAQVSALSGGGSSSVPRPLQPPPPPPRPAPRGADPWVHSDPWQKAGQVPGEKSPQGSRRAASDPQPEGLDMSFPDTNFNRIIMGGWLEDTKRAQIETECWEAIAKMELVVPNIAVYGKRGRTAHLLLPELPMREAKSRFYDLQTKYSNKLSLGSSDRALWLAPSRTRERRLKLSLIHI